MEKYLFTCGTHRNTHKRHSFCGYACLSSLFLCDNNWFENFSMNFSQGNRINLPMRGGNEIDNNAIVCTVIYVARSLLLSCSSINLIFLFHDLSCGKSCADNIYIRNIRCQNVGHLIY